MNYSKNLQCSFCTEMTNYINNNQRDLSFYQVKSYGNYHDGSFLLCYVMTQKNNHDNYITYCNLLNKYPVENDPQYVQIVDGNPNQCQMPYFYPQTNPEAAQCNDFSSYNKVDKADTDRGIIICTCNEFVNNNFRNRNAFENLQMEKCFLPKMTSNLQIQRNQDSIDSPEKSIDELHDNSIYSNGSILSDPMCRFCHLSKNTQSDLLISPCYCSGTLKYVHQNCLKTWLDVSKKQRSVHSGDKSPHCELCNFKYIRKRKFQFGKIRHPKLSPNDCALHLIFLCSLLVMVTSASVTILCFAMEKSVSNNNRPPFYDKTSEGIITNSNGNPSLRSKKQNILCEYLSHLSFKDYSQTHRQSSTKLSVICGIPFDKKQESNIKMNRNSLFQTTEPLPWPTTTTTTTTTTTIMSEPKKKSHSRIFSKINNQNGTQLWILSPEEAVTLASGVIFFIAFFIAMVVQVKSSYTCYQLVMQWIRMNYTYEVQSLNMTRNKEIIEMKPTNSIGHISNNDADKKLNTAPREYIERCITEI